jgi:hypothetical protein
VTRWEYTYVTSSPGDEEKLMPKFKELGQSGYELVTFLETPDHEAERIWLLRLRAGSLREDQ